MSLIMQRDSQFDDFCHFLIAEWEGKRRHSYRVPNRGKSAAWSQSLHNGVWSAAGLKDALDLYNWNGTSLPHNKADLDDLAQRLQDAIAKTDDTQVCNLAREIMKWGGVDNLHRQKRTFSWIIRNARSISRRLKEATRQLLDKASDLEDFDGETLIMNSAMTKIISLADPSGSLIIYDGRVGSAFAFFVTKYAETRGISRLHLSKDLLFAVDKQSGRNPDTKTIIFPSLFGKNKDRSHAAMMRRASEVVAQVVMKCGVSARDIEAALFMWGYSVKSDTDTVFGEK